jgi:hypothetical protein
MWNRLNLADLDDETKRERVAFGVVSALESTDWPRVTGQRPETLDLSRVYTQTEIVELLLTISKHRFWLAWEDGREDPRPEYAPYTEEWLLENYSSIHGKIIRNSDPEEYWMITGWRNWTFGPELLLVFCPEGRLRWTKHLWLLPETCRGTVFADTGDPVAIRRERQWIDW